MKKFIIKANNRPCEPTERTFPKNCGHCNDKNKPCLGEMIRQIIISEIDKW